MEVFSRCAGCGMRFLVPREMRFYQTCAVKAMCKKSEVEMEKECVVKTFQASPGASWERNPEVFEKATTPADAGTPPWVAVCPISSVEEIESAYRWMVWARDRLVGLKEAESRVWDRDQTIRGLEDRLQDLEGQLTDWKRNAVHADQHQKVRGELKDEVGRLAAEAKDLKERAERAEAMCEQALAERDYWRQRAEENGKLAAEQMAVARDLVGRVPEKAHADVLKDLAAARRDCNDFAARWQDVKWQLDASVTERKSLKDQCSRLVDKLNEAEGLVRQRNEQRKQVDKLLAELSARKAGGVEALEVGSTVELIGPVGQQAYRATVEAVEVSRGGVLRYRVAWWKDGRHETVVNAHEVRAEPLPDVKLDAMTSALKVT